MPGIKRKAICQVLDGTAKRDELNGKALVDTPVCQGFAGVKVLQVWGTAIWRGPPTATTVFRELPINRQHGLIRAAPAIRNGGWRSFWMASALKGLKHAPTGLGFVFGNSASHTQPAVHIQ